MKSFCLIVGLFGSLALANQPNTQRAKEVFKSSKVVTKEISSLEERGFVCQEPAGSVLFMSYGDEGYISRLNVSSVCVTGKAPATLVVKVVSALVTILQGPELVEKVELINPSKIVELTEASN